MGDAPIKLEDSWQRILDAVPDLITVLDLTYKVIRVNKAMADRLGQTPEICIGMQCHNLLHGLDTPPDYCPHSKLLLDGKQHGCEIRYEKVTGVFDVVCSPLSDSDGKLMGGVCVAQDITRRKHAADELRLMSTRLILATKAASIGIWEYNISARKFFWDEAMYRLYGITPDKFSSSYEAWEAMLHSDDLLQIREHVQRAIRGEAEFDTAFRVIWPDGTIHNIKANAVVEYDEAGNPIRMVGTNWDFTKRYVAEEALKEKTAFLETFNKAMIGREMRIIELKESVNQLCCELGRPIPYPPVWNQTSDTDANSQNQDPGKKSGQ
ncbi:MAG: PAS domain-containing protein [Candidatus Riflebacteria bacterium]|nr:PAS domain-containing protein [Candidatus Riflebacteria bacterium]